MNQLSKFRIAHKFCLLFVFLAGVLNLPLSAGTISQTYYFDEPSLSRKEGYDYVELRDCFQLEAPTKPLLPYKAVRLLIPPGEEAVEVSVVSFGKTRLGEGYRVYPAQYDVPISNAYQKKFTPPDPETYSSNQVYPIINHANLDTGFYRGHSIASVDIYPLEYIPSSGELSYYSSMTVTISTAATRSSSDSNGRLYRSSDNTRSKVEEWVHNPGQLSLYPIQNQDRQVYPVTYLIITTEEYQEAFTAFIRFKRQQGFSVAMRTVESIYSSYSGFDEQDKIRNCIIDYYTNTEIEYVLLGGDTELVPHRNLFGHIWMTADPDPIHVIDNIASDLYYGGLDRVGTGSGPDWNVDNDDMWGEVIDDDPSSGNINEADFIADVMVGRISADSAQEFANALNKLIMYQKKPVQLDNKKAIMVGQKMWDGYCGDEAKEQVRLGGTYNGYYTYGLENKGIVSQLQYAAAYPDSAWPVGDLITKMNNGATYLNHLGHGNVHGYMNFSTNDGSVDLLTANGKNHNYHFIYSQTCYGSSFDNRLIDGSTVSATDCMTEKFTTHEKGVMAVIGNSRFGLSGSGQVFDRYFFDAMCKNNNPTNIVGEMQQYSKINSGHSTSGYRWSYYELNLFGDPAMEFWQSSSLASVNSVTVQTTPSLGMSQITVQVNPTISGMRVSLCTDTGIFGTALTNSSGIATVSLSQSVDSEIPIYGMVTYNNYVPREFITGWYPLTWTGAVSSNWHDPANWYPNQVPNPSTEVVIPAYEAYAPSISGGAAYCKKMTIEDNGAVLIGSEVLAVYEDIDVHGMIRLFSGSSVLAGSNNIHWFTGSSLEVTSAGASIECKVGFIIDDGANVQMLQGTLKFLSGMANPTVDYDAYIINQSALTQLGTVISAKETIYSLVISGLSTQPFTINGDLKCLQNRRIRSYFNGIVSLKGNLISENTNGPGIYWTNGTLKLTGTNQSITIPHSSGYLFTLWAANNGTVSFPHALCLKGNLKIDSLAQLVVNANNLTVDGTAVFDGKLVMNHAEGNLTVKGSVTWFAGSSVEINSDGVEIFCKGSMNFVSGADFNMIRGLVEFYGDNDAIIANYNSTTKFHHLRINKSAGAALAISAVSTQNIYITGDFTNNQNSIFRSYSINSVILTGNFSSLNTNSAGINWEAGTLVLVGESPHLSFAHSGDYLWSLRSYPLINGNGYISTNATVKGDFTIARGPFFVGGNTLSVGGNWMVQGSGSFEKGSSTVIFNGTGTQTVSSSSFNILRLNKAGGEADNKLVISSNIIVNVASYKYDAGTLEVTGGSFVVADLADSNVKGNYTISSGLISLTQDTQYFVDLDANLNISGGKVSIQGGYNYPVDWAYTRPVTIIMSAGVLEYNSKNINLTNTGYALNLQITGGTIRTKGSFTISRTETIFPGGTIELYGTGDTTMSNADGSSFYNVKINKTSTRSEGDQDRSNKVTIAQNAAITGDLTVWSGTLALNAVEVNVARDLYVYGLFQMNNTGAVLTIGRDFVLGGSSNAELTRGTIKITRNFSQTANTPLLSSALNTISFTGFGDSNLTIMNPAVSLGNLGINKGSGTVGISTTAAALNLLGNMYVGVGNQFLFGTIPTVIAGSLNVSGAIVLSTGGSVTCHDLDMNGDISVAGVLSVQNSFYQLDGTQLIIGSSGNFIIDKPYTGNYLSFGGTTILNGGAITITNEGVDFGITSNLTINSGTLKIGGAMRALSPDSFHMSTGSLEFIGSRSASIQLAEGNYLNNVIVSKTGTGVVMLSSDLLLRDLRINSGTFQVLHRTLNISGNLNIINGTLDAAFADDLINLNGWWNNNCSPNGFTQGSGTVAFVGLERSVIYQSEHFNNLIINKSGEYPYCVELDTGTILSADSLSYVDGTLSLKGGSTFNTPTSGINLPWGCAIYCDPTNPSTINLNGDWTDQNMTIDANQGFSSGASIVNVLGTGNRQIASFMLKFNDLNINLSGGNCYISSYSPEFTGNVQLISGTLSADFSSNFTLHKSLNTSAGTTLALPSCYLNFVGSADAELSLGGASDYGSLTINKETGSSVSLGATLNMPASSMLYVQQGCLQLASQVLSAGGDVSIGSGAEILVNANAQLLMPDWRMLYVNSGGKLSAIGSSSQPALISRTGDGYYSLDIYSGATIAAEYAIFEFMNYSGVNIQSGASVSTESSFNNCSFCNGDSGGTLLSINNEQAITITDAIFPENTWFGMSNVSKSYNTGSVRFLGESGAYAGSGFESDPYMRINWNNDVPTIATNQSSLNFGSVYLPMVEYRTFTITNNGSGSLAGTLLLPDDFTASIYRTESRIEGSKMDEPQRTSNLEFIALPGSSITVQVAFFPTQPIAYNSTLVITHNAGGAPINISLTGNGMGPQITVNPTQIIKGILPEGYHTEPLSITDSGNTALSYYATIEYPSRSREVIMAESFETSFPPTGWSTSVVQQVGTAGVWNRSIGTVHPQNSNSQNGQYLAYFNSWSCADGNQTRLRTGVLNFTGYSNISLSFWMFHDSGFATDYDRIQVQMIRVQEDWENVGEPIIRNSSPYGWQQHTINLSAYANEHNLYLGFLGISEYGNDIHIDNIVITGSNPPTGWVSFNGESETLSSVLAPGASDQPIIYIYTEGMDNGIYQAEIHIASNDPITPVKIVPIEISVGSPGLSISPVAIDFGVQQTGTSSTQNFNIEATGSLHLSGTITAPAGYSIQAATRAEVVSSLKESTPNRWSSSVAYTLSPGELESYTVKFSPTAIQAYNGSISITSDHLATQTIQLSGTGASVPTVQTLAATSITSSTAILNAQIISTGGLISWRGFKYGTDPDPINNGNDYFVSGSNNTYDASPIGFEAGQQIYFCAFAYNELGWSYGEVLSFTTLNPQLLIIPTSAIGFGAVAINTTSAAHSFTVSGSQLSGNVGLNASAGFRIFLNSGRRAERQTTDQITLYPVAGVLEETTIFVVFEPTLVQLYSGTVSIVTMDVAQRDIALVGDGITIPTIIASDATEITLSSATSGGNITFNGNNAITAKGVCFSVLPDPTLADDHTSDGEGSEVFTSYLSDLLPGTQYYVRAYATNLAGTAYSESVTFITLSIPLVSASPMVLESFGSIIVGDNSAIKSFIVAGSGLSTNLIVTAPTGFQIALSERGRQRDYSSEVSIAPSSGSVFETFLVRFAPSSGGVFADSILISSTGAETEAVMVSGIGITKPVLTTKPITDITSGSAGSGGIVSSDGFSEITICGICWGLSSEPTTADDFYSLKLPVALDYSLVMDNLLPNTTYFVRAFAINSAGIAYGNEQSFNTLGQALAAPTNLSISIIAGSAELNWDAVQGAVSYKIHRSLNPYAADWGAPIATTSNHEWTDATSSARYFYKVAASSDVVRD